MLLTVVAIALAFLAGSIPFGVIAGKVKGVDVRAHGSGNIGATNAARVLGKRVGVVVLLCDAAKGAVPVWLARAYVAPRVPHGEWVVAAVAAAAFAGHLAPPWLRFRGGKGVATALGVFVAAAPWAALVAASVFVACYAVWRLSSVGSLAAATAFIPMMWILGYGPPLRALAVAIWVLIVWKHRGNIERLLAHKENKV